MKLRLVLPLWVHQRLDALAVRIAASPRSSLKDEHSRMASRIANQELEIESLQSQLDHMVKTMNRYSAQRDSAQRRSMTLVNLSCQDAFFGRREATQQDIDRMEATIEKLTGRATAWADKEASP
jgi:uncharacterized coiled-coil protein SlyX